MDPYAPALLRQCQRQCFQPRSHCRSNDSRSASGRLPLRQQNPARRLRNCRGPQPDHGQYRLLLHSVADHLYSPLSGRTRPQSQKPFFVFWPLEARHLTVSIHEAARQARHQSLACLAHLWLGSLRSPCRIGGFVCSRKSPASAVRRQVPNHVPAGGLFPFDSPVPLFNPPPGFQLRLGANPTDEFLSGTFPVGNQTIGFIRIPRFAPFNEGQAVQQFQGEITFFQQNTGGLVVDVMGNGGGDGCYMNLLIQYLVPIGFQPIRLKVRATEEWAISYEIGLFVAEQIGAGQDTITTL